MRYYSPATLSENIHETPEGFLICLGVPIARAGDLLYAPEETPITPAESRQATIIHRDAATIHAPETIASFEGKPVTLNHPVGGDFVTPENWKHLAVGTVQNVRPGTQDEAHLLLADLLITDAAAITAVKTKALREVSCGYDADFIEEAPGRGRQQNIIGNHVALVAAGRCGIECAIVDQANQGGVAMKLKDKIMDAFKKMLDESGLPDEAGAAPKSDQTKVEDGLSTLSQRVDDEMAKMGTRFGVIESALAKLLGIESLDQMGQAPAPVAAPVGDAALCTDAETIARAEILAPGIAKTKDVTRKALDAAMANEDTKVLLVPLLRGKTLDALTTEEMDIAFVAAAEILKATRREALTKRNTIDGLPSIQAGVMTPEKLNEVHAKQYK